MPATLAVSYRKRHEAIGKKGAHEASFLFGDENAIDSEPIAQLQNSKQISKPTSPISVAVNFDLASLGELKPLELPGAWTTVGKRGKAIKNDKMYEDYAKSNLKKKKKKSRSQPRKPCADNEPLAALEEAPSSSKCLTALERTTAQRSKQLARAQMAKHWARYQSAKQLKKGALDQLVAALMAEDDEGEYMDDAAGPPQMASTRAPTKDHKANRPKDKARRLARSAASAARCIVHDDDDDDSERAVLSEATVPAKEAAGPRKARPSAELERPVTLPSAWTTVGKRGKAMSQFPPLNKASDTKAEHKAGHMPTRQVAFPGASSQPMHQRKASEPQPVAQIDKAAAKRGKSGKQSCSVM